MSELPKYPDLLNRILSTRIEHLRFSVRSYNTLKRARISSLERIIKLGEDGCIFFVHNLGHVQLDEIFNSVADYLKVERTDLANIDILVKSLNEKSIEELRDICVPDDVENVNDNQIVSEEPLPPPKDTRPLIIEIASDITPNIIEYIVLFSRTLLGKGRYKQRGFEILKRRYGLQKTRLYTLEELGNYYDITRERVRQIALGAISKIRDALLDNKISKGWRVPQELIDEAKALVELFQSSDDLLTEKEIVESIESRYDVEFSQDDLSNVRFLLRVFNFRPMPKYFADFSRDFAPTWIITEGFKPQPIFQIAKSIYNIVCSSAAPISSFDLKIQLNRRYKEKVDDCRIKLSVKILQEIESIGEDNFQVKFEDLPSLADRAFRILYENNTTPMHLRDLQRQINYRMVKAGFRTEAGKRNLGNQMASDPRFHAIGRSGMWSLAEWKNIRHETIIELMQEFFHSKQACATPDEIYAFVISKRDVAKNSVTLYLSTNDLFVRVSKTEYELAVWGSKPYQPAPQMSSAEIKKLLTSAIKAIFSGRTNETMPLSELRHEIHKRTSIPESTLVINIRKSPLIQLKDDSASKRRKIAYYVGDKVPVSATPARSTVRNIVQQEVKQHLGKHPDKKSSVADLAIYIERATSCKKTTFYRYLSEMERTGDIIKEYEDGKLFCRLEMTDAYTTSTALSFPQIEDVKDIVLRNNLVNAINNLTIDNVDLGLFQLGKIFENALKGFLRKARDRGKFAITSEDLSRLASMIDCVKRNKIIQKKHHLTLLREHRNERVHGEIPNLEERKRLMQYKAPFLAGLYIEYILIFNKQIQTL